MGRNQNGDSCSSYLFLSFFFFLVVGCSVQTGRKLINGVKEIVLNTEKTFFDADCRDEDSYENEWPKKKVNVVDESILNTIREIILNEVDQIKEDYFPNLSEYDYRKEFYGDSRLNTILECRLYYKGILELVINDNILKIAEEHFDGEANLLVIHQLRFDFPTNESIARFSGSWHYDNYHERNHITFWIPLQNINEQTGGLIWSENQELKKIIKHGMRPATYFSLDRNIKEYIDRLTLNSAIEARCNISDVYYFKKELFHAGSRPISEVRISLDIRLGDSKENVLFQEIKKILQAHNINLRKKVGLCLRFYESKLIRQSFKVKDIKRIRKIYLLHLRKLKDNVFIEKLPLADRLYVFLFYFIKRIFVKVSMQIVLKLMRALKVEYK